MLAPRNRDELAARLAAVPIALILAVAAPSRSQETPSQPSPKSYPIRTTALHGAARGGRVIGTIPPGAELVATGASQGPLMPVRLSGWSLESAPTLVFAAVGRRIKQLELTLPRPAQRRVWGRQTDPYGGSWEQVTVDGWIDRSEVVADRNAVWKQAESLYHERCGGCHALHPPAEFTANQWPNVVKIMAHNAAFTPEQAALVTQYLQTHAKDAGPS